MWEEQWSAQEVTDCVTLELYPGARGGLLNLRIEFTRGIAIVKGLYAVSQSTLDVPLYM